MLRHFVVLISIFLVLMVLTIVPGCVNQSTNNFPKSVPDPTGVTPFETLAVSVVPSDASGVMPSGIPSNQISSRPVALVTTQSRITNDTPGDPTTPAMELQRLNAVITPLPYPPGDYVPGQILVAYDANLTPDQRIAIASELNKEIGATVIDSFRHGQQLHLPPDVSVELAIAFYQQNRSVEIAEPNFIITIPDCSKGPC